MEIRVGGRPLTVTMRTPGDDFDLAAGFLVSEGVVHGAEDVAGIRYCAGATADGGNTYNVVDVGLAPGVAAPDASLERNFYTTSSCGLCGKASLDAVRTTAAWSVAEDPLSIGTDVLTALPDRLRAAQRVFDSTGGLHAAGLFTADGEPVCLREDVGRHNAVDKVVGHALRSGLLPLRGSVLMVSGRASFELVQKAVMAGCPAARGGLRALLARGRPGRGERSDPGRVPARRLHERVHGCRAAAPGAGGVTGGVRRVARERGPDGRPAAARAPVGRLAFREAVR